MLPAGAGVTSEEDMKCLVEGKLLLNTPNGRATYDTLKGLEDMDEVELVEWSWYGYITDAEPGM